MRTDSEYLGPQNGHITGPSTRHPLAFPHQAGPPSPVLRKVHEWSNLPEITIRLRNIHPETTSYDIYRNFERHGQIVMIEIFEDRSGSRDGRAQIKFSPPPQRAFWMRPGSQEKYEMIIKDGLTRYCCIIDIDEQNKKRTFKIQSPIRKTVFYDEKMQLMLSSLNFGVMLDLETMMIMESINAVPGDELSFTVNLLRNKIVTSFMVDFKDPRGRAEASYVETHLRRKNKYSFEVPFAQLKMIERVVLSNSQIALVISLDSPPTFFRKREDEKACHSNDNLLWTDSDTWFRQTDIVWDPYRLSNDVVTLHKERPVIDIGMSSVHLGRLY
jgi:RNA-dependent RNA polymerase